MSDDRPYSDDDLDDQPVAGGLDHYSDGASQEDLYQDGAGDQGEEPEPEPEPEPKPERKVSKKMKAKLASIRQNLKSAS